MERWIGKSAKDTPKLGSSSSSSLSSFDSQRGGEGLAAALPSSSDQSCILFNKSSRQVVSLLTCSKLCTICFVAGIVVGYTLKRRVRRWASRLLKKIRDE